MEPLDPELRKLIDDGLPAATPGGDAESRGLESLLAHVDAPPVPTGVPAAPMLGKVALVVATVVTAGGTWIASRSPAESDPGVPPPIEQPYHPELGPPSEQTPAPSLPVDRGQPTNPARPPVEVAPRTRPRPRRTAPAAHETTTPSPSTTADALRAEADLIAKAESALDRGKPKEALALCDFHRTGFHAPQLTTEREAIAASAACMVEATDTRRATAFVQAHPRGALTAKVRQRCGLVGDNKVSQDP
ncbi:MAG: hypothetical protein ACRBN8_12430 [Nannocystales bacterium]